MIIPGIQLGEVRINDALDNYPNSSFIKNLSLNQKLVNWGNYTIRTNENNKINWICSTVDVVGDYKTKIKIGANFKNIIDDFVLLYDDFDSLFHIKEVNGLCFTFSELPISSSNLKSNIISKLMVYDVKMDENNYLLGLDEISTENLTDYLSN